MPKQTNDALSAARIRDNQRRSRNRRAELMKELQARVREYERKEVEATQEMQRSALNVALENSRLRELLAQNGISRKGVDDYLRSCEKASGSTGNTRPTERRPTRLTERETRFDTTQGSVLVQIPRDYHDDRDDRELVYEPVSNYHEQSFIEQQHPEYTQGQSSSSEHTINSMRRDVEALGRTHVMAVTENPDCPNTSECFCPPPTTEREQSLSPSGLEISCETAATIISEMRGEGDRDSIRASLGCQGREDCNIKNSVVLQILDEG